MRVERGNATSGYDHREVERAWDRVFGTFEKELVAAEAIEPASLLTATVRES